MKNFNMPSATKTLFIKRVLDSQKFFTWVCLVTWLVIILLPVSLDAREGNIRLRRLSVEHGLSATTVFSIFQDSRGFVWFGTEDGLNRYDGHNIVTYRNNPDDTNTLSHNYIQVIYETPSEPDILWIGTSQGLNSFHRPTETFKRYFEKYSISALYEAPKRPGILWVGATDGMMELKYGQNKKDHQPKINRFQPDPSNPSAGANHMRAIFASVSEPHILWLGTSAGLYKFNSAVHQFNRFLVNPSNPSAPANIIRAIYQNKTQPHILWIGTHGKGVKRFDTKTGRFHALKAGEAAENHIITAICESSAEDGILWVGGFDCGLMKYDTKGNLLDAYRKQEGETPGLPGNDISALFEDRSGVLWLGTSGSGAGWLPGRENFEHIKTAKNENEQGLSHGYVRAVMEDYNRNLWIGTSGGLDKLNRDTGRFTHYKSKPGQLPDNRVNAIFESMIEPGILWIGTAGGLGRLEISNNRWMRFQERNGTRDGLIHPTVTAIYESPSQPGLLWIATRGGLDSFDFQTRKWTHYADNDDKPVDFEVDAIFEDADGTLWFGTVGGLLEFNRKSNRWKRYTYVPNQNSLSHNTVRCIYEAPTAPGILWIGTSRGLNRLDKKSGEFKFYGIDDGLPNQMIFGILGHKNNDGQIRHLYISTNNGLARMDIQSGEFRNFDLRDGLQHNVFTPGAYDRGRGGEMFFGGINGLNAFYPEEVRENPTPPQIAITGFQRFNKTVNPGEEIDGRVLLHQPVNETQELVLSYRDTVFAFEFAALHFNIPEKNQYAYMMVGFNREWVHSGSRRYAEYTNLEPGDYVFKVKAANCDGLWSKTGKSINISIKPPFWMTWWFQVSAFLFLLAAAWGLHLLRVKKIKQRSEMLEKQVVERTHEIREQKDIIEDKNTQIMGSIRYAERIQSAILPLDRRIEKILPHYFVIFKPKDIVSGDFYWVNKIGDKIFFAMVDCTGHGVPGAFMSMIGNTLFNQIINENKISEPARILQNLNLGVRRALKQEKDETESHDGMEVCLCVLEGNRLTFTGAKRPLFMVRAPRGKAEFQEIKGTRQAIGGWQKSKIKEFENNYFEVNHGDMLYMTTDGIIDQQNSADVRFGSKRLRELLLRVSSLEMPQQQRAILQELHNHQENEEQRDDITIMGIKICLE